MIFWKLPDGLWLKNASKRSKWMAKFQTKLKLRFAQQGWPDPDTDLLVRASTLPPREARQCWRKWKSANDIDDCNWPQFKLLTRFSGRLPMVDPECPEIPRLNGMAKALWTNSQLQLNRSAKALDVLLALGIPVYLMKSAALEALRLGTTTRRVTSDIDLVVHRNDLRRSLAALMEAGWGAGETIDQAVDRCRYHPGINLTKGSQEAKDRSDVDVHHQPVHLPFLPDSTMAGIWERAVNARFRGRDVVAPAPEELLVFAAMQGVRRFIPSHLSSGLWPLDVVEIIQAPSLNWNRALSTAVECGGTWALLCCLDYVRQKLNANVPSIIISDLAAESGDWRQTMNFYAQAPTYGAFKLFHLPIRELALINRHKAFCKRGWLASRNW
ncbi:MAG: nucleotidyltransferase family protein [Anderseniella sp.]